MHLTKKYIAVIAIIICAILVLAVWKLPLKFKLIPTTISIPTISWGSTQADRDVKVSITGHVTNNSGISFVCPKTPSTFKADDILCMKPMQFLPNYKNPCWYREDTPTQLSCAPYFLQIGMSKCATSDLFSRLIRHPDIVPIKGIGGKSKSITWWNLGLTGSKWKPPYTGGKRETFKQYIDKFTNAAKIIKNNTDQNGLHSKITGEGSPTYLWMMYLWDQIPQNTYLTEPKVLVPHLIRHLLPQTKFIVTLRDPIDRMYSSYHFFNKDEKYDKNAFHESMVFAIEKFLACRAKMGDRLCVLDKDLRASTSSKVRLMNSMYYLYIKEWLNVFPREQFIFIKMEDYVITKAETLNRIFKFLGLATLSPKEMEEYKVLYSMIRNKTKGDKQYEPMLNATRELLYTIYDPYTNMLPQLLRDSSFTWPKISYEEYVQKMLRKKTDASAQQPAQ